MPHSFSNLSRTAVFERQLLMLQEAGQQGEGGGDGGGGSGSGLDYLSQLIPRNPFPDLALGHHSYARSSYANHHVEYEDEEGAGGGGDNDEWMNRQSVIKFEDVGDEDGEEAEEREVRRPEYKSSPSRNLVRPLASILWLGPD